MWRQALILLSWLTSTNLPSGQACQREPNRYADRSLGRRRVRKHTECLVGMRGEDDVVEAIFGSRRIADSDAVLFPNHRANIRSKTIRGLISMGRGVVGELHEIVFRYAQLKPGEHAPT